MPRILCINKHDRHDPFERISNFGGINPNGDRWKLPHRDAIAWAEDPSKEPFWVEQNGKRVAVVVSVSRFGNKYLTTSPDGNEVNNLLNLPECP